MAGIPIPANCYLYTHCESLGWVYGSRRWRSTNGKKLYEWDSLHGEIEVYNKRGKHLGVLDHLGNPIKNAVEGRTIDI